MGAFTFLHAADLHLDTPFEGLAAKDGAIAAALRDASLDAWNRLVEAALERRVAFVVLAGDLYDGPERGLRAQLRFLRGLERLSAAGIGVFVVHGNHDPLEEGWSALRELPAGVHVFSAGQPEAVHFRRDGELLAVVHGVSFARRAERENLVRRFRRGSEDALHVGVLHCNVEGQDGHDPYAPCSLADLRAAGMDYWALGHVHTRQTLAQAPWVVYPGNLQGRSHKPAECGPKGAVLVHAGGGAIRGIDFLPLAPVRFERLVVDVGGLPDLAALERRVREGLQPLLQSEGTRGLVLRLSIEGRGPLHRDLAGGVAQLEEALADLAAGLDPWVSWERIELRTAPPIDRAALLAREDFAGALLRRLDALRSDPEALEAFVAAVDDDLVRGDLAREIEAAKGAEALSLLDAAETLAIDHFGETT